MSISKDKRIEKLKKIRIWPSVWGMVFISFCLFVIMVAVASFLVTDIVKNKMIEGYHNAESLIYLTELIGTPGEIKEIEEQLRLYIDMEEDVESIVIFQDDNAVLWASDDRYPSLKYGAEFFFDDVKVYIEEDSSNAIKIDDGELHIEKDFIDFKLALNASQDDVLSENSNIVCGQLKLWYEIPSQIGNIYVLTNLRIYPYDLFALIVCSCLLVAVVVIFVLYYLVSVIRLIFSMSKTTKVIYSDMVTGGHNRFYFEKKGNSILKRAARRGQKYAVIHLRMRKYRSYCTCFGVKEGEALIEKCHIILKKYIRRKEIMAHRENAQFALLLIYENREQLIARLENMERVLNAISPNVKLYFGVGIYLTQIGDKDIEQLHNNAMLACDMLEDGVENKIAFYDVEMNKQRLWERKVEDDMNRALENKEFQVYLQPKISTAEETLAGAEALVRWIHPEEGFIPPNKFIPIFESNGFITKLDDYMLQEVAALQAEWISKGRKIVPISVNISRAHFTRNDLAAHISRIVDQYQIPHNVIELELTESAFFDDKELLLKTIAQLRESGFCVSMDDFGAGYSSLNSLKEMHIDVLKIDADFFRGADVEERGMLIVSEVIDLAKKLNMKIVAEGIESREQVEFLTEQECDLIQGYFYAKPMPIIQFLEKYKDIDESIS